MDKTDSDYPETFWDVLFEGGFLSFMNSYGLPAIAVGFLFIAPLVSLFIFIFWGFANA